MKHGRHYKKNPEGIEYTDQNFDAYSVEYTFADGTKMYMDGRGIPGTADQVAPLGRPGREREVELAERV